MAKIAEVTAVEMQGAPYRAALPRTACFICLLVPYK